MGALLCPVAVLLAAAAPAEKAPPELKGIDATCKAAAKLDDAHKLNSRSLITDAVRPQANDGRDRWRAFKTNEELRTYLEKEGAPNTSAWIWNAPDRTTIVGMYFQSDTGDWSLDVNYCFRPDGSLARLESKVNNLAGGDSGERVTYTRTDGSVLFERATAFDTDHQRLPDADDLDHPPLYPTVKSLPFLAPPGSAPPPVKPPVPDGSLDAAGVTRFVEAHAGEARSCYEREAAKHPELAGILVMSWAITIDGTTSKIAWVRDTMRSPAVEKCVEEVIAKWRFDAKPHKRMYAEHQWEFAAKSRPDAAADPDVGLDQAGVVRFVREHLGDVKGCYDRELARRPGLAGKVVMHWTIDASGATHTIDMESNTLPTIEAGACLRDVIRKWRFAPAPVGGGLEVSFPFVFRSAGRRDGGAGAEGGAGARRR